MTITAPAVPFTLYSWGRTHSPHSGFPERVAFPEAAWKSQKNITDNVFQQNLQVLRAAPKKARPSDSVHAVSGSRLLGGCWVDAFEVLQKEWQACLSSKEPSLTLMWEATMQTYPETELGPSLSSGTCQSLLRSWTPAMAEAVAVRSSALLVVTLASQAGAAAGWAGSSPRLGKPRSRP